MTAPVGLPGPVLDWLGGHALPGISVVSAAPLVGGFRNENLLLTTADGDRFVLRRYLRTNRCAIEVALARRLAGVVPVPAVMAADQTGELAGEPLLLTEYVYGELASMVLARDDRFAGEVGEALGGVLAGIGTVGFAGPGLFGGPELVPTMEYMPTQLAEFVADCLAIGNADTALSPAEQADLVTLAERAQPALDSVAGARQLVHSDFNPKNVLLARRAGRWSVAAVLDWEFAFSGHPLTDVGNVLRFAGSEGDTPAFEAGFTGGFTGAGGSLPEGWLATARALDLFALADLLTRPPDSPLFDRVIGVVRARLAELEGKR